MTEAFGALAGAPSGCPASTTVISCWPMSLSGQQRPITTVDDESGLPPTADELLRHGKGRKGSSKPVVTNGLELTIRRGVE